MHVNMLQSQIQMNRRVIYDIEQSIKCLQMEIRWYKQGLYHKDMYKHKYREIESLKKTLKKLVSLQRSLRNEISDIVRYMRLVKDALC